VDALGLLLALGVLLWIPTHILTFTIKYQADYDRAGIPTFPACFGVPATRAAITASTLLAVLAFLTAGHWIGMSPLYLGGLGVLGVVLVALVTWSLVRPHPRLNFALYKGASIYMAASMLLIIAGGW
jgi:protoheme IX farnesyltransferase